MSDALTVGAGGLARYLILDLGPSTSAAAKAMMPQ